MFVAKSAKEKCQKGFKGKKWLEVSLEENHSTPDGQLGHQVGSSSKFKELYAKRQAET